MVVSPDASRITDFSRVIAPMTPETFFAEYYEKKHLVIRREDAGYFRDLLSVADIDQVLTQTQLPLDDMNMVNNGSQISPDAYSTQSGHADPVLVAQQFASGGTIILPGLQRHVAQLAAYCRAMETVFCCDLQTNIYFTPASAQGFKTHYDSHDVFVLQTQGSKSWRIYDSPMVLPLRSQAFSPKGFVPGKVIDSFVLNAGDMCYVPRGVVHDAIATDEMSLHITTGLLSHRWIDLLVDAIIDHAHDNPALRGSLPPGYANGDYDPAEAHQTFQELMKIAAEGIDPAQTLDAAARNYRRRRNPAVPGQLLQSFAAGDVGPGSVVAPREHLIHSFIRLRTEQVDEIVLDVYGSEIAFPAYVEPTLRDAIGRTAPFRIGDLAGDLDDEGQAVMVRRLIREGVLYVPA